MEIAPPVATDASPLSARIRPCAPPSARAAGSSRVGASAIPKRPATARSALQTLRTSTTAWSFLDTTAADGANPCARTRSVTARQRPATSRERSVDIRVVLPKRPVTARAGKQRRDAAAMSGIDCARVRIEPLTVTDTRAIREAAQRECAHEAYCSPLHGKSVEPRSVALATRSAESVVNAVSLHESLRVKAFQTRARGDYEQAIPYYIKALELAPDDHVTRFQLAVAYERTGSSASALATYEHVLAHAPANYFAHYNTANILMKCERTSDAIQHYTHAIELCDVRDCQQRAVFYRQRGAAYRANGDFEKASRDYAHYHARTRRSAMVSGDPSRGVRDALAGTGAKPDLLSSNDRNAHTSTVVYNTDSLYAVPEATSTAMSLQQTESAFESWTREQVFAAVQSQRGQRNEADVHLVVDALQKVFPFCAALRPEACAALGACIVGASNLRPGTPLFLERMRGSHIFFIYRGRVTAHKTIVQRIVQVSSPSKVSPTTTTLPNEPESNNNGDRGSVASADGDDARDTAQCSSTQSWESLFAEFEQDRQAENDAAFAATLSRVAPITSHWLKQQMELSSFAHGDIVGYQGRHDQTPRAYSAIVAEECDVLALSWRDLAEVEKLQRAAEAESIARFLRTVPTFHGIAVSELLALAHHAKRVKPIGSKVVCSEGQFVDGLFVVRQGEVCQLAPSNVRLPPDLSIAFNLCGAFAVPAHEQEQTRRAFFTQLEFADDPLAFAHLSDVCHGFLPFDFIDKRVQELHAIARADATTESASASEVAPPPARRKALIGTASHPVTALSLQRASCFFASSSWIPPRRSRQVSTSSAGVARAKSALVSRSTADLLFFTSTDVVTALSVASRELLQRNAHTSANSGPTATTTQRGRATAATPAPVALGHDMLEQLSWSQRWSAYKQTLVAAVLLNKRSTRSRSCFQTPL